MAIPMMPGMRLYQGVTLATNSLEDLEAITDPSKFRLTQAELDDYIAELTTLRAWLYICGCLISTEILQLLQK